MKINHEIEECHVQLKSFDFYEMKWFYWCMKMDWLLKNVFIWDIGGLERVINVILRGSSS